MEAASYSSSLRDPASAEVTGAEEDFPRIWVPSWENRDVRQLRSVCACPTMVNNIPSTTRKLRLRNMRNRTVS
jgi:hypothetical protein